MIEPGGHSLEQALAMLTEREARVLTMRFGLDGGQEQTLAEVGQVLNVTRQRAQQIELDALRKIGEALKTKDGERQ
jgi:RNA polymerase sigma factor (sigma-70 family)